MSGDDKPLVWMHGEVKTPPFSRSARLKAGFLLRLLQRGESIGVPQSKPSELRIPDSDKRWRIIYRIDTDAIVIAEVFPKKSGKTPKWVLDVCRRRFRDYDNG